MKSLLLIILFFATMASQAKGTYTHYFYNPAINRIDSVVNSQLPLVAQGVSTVYNDMKVLTGQAGDFLKKIAPKLGVAADKVWETLVKQQQVWAMMYTFIALLYVFTWIMFVQRLKAGAQNAERDKWKAFDVTLCLFSGALVFVGTITVGVNWTSIWTGWFNPEYGAMIQLAEFAKSLNII